MTTVLAWRTPSSVDGTLAAARAVGRQGRPRGGGRAGPRGEAPPARATAGRPGGGRRRGGRRAAPPERRLDLYRRRAAVRPIRPFPDLRGATRSGRGAARPRPPTGSRPKMRNRLSDHTSVCSAGIQSLWPTCASCSAASSSARDMSSGEPTVLARIGTAPYPRPATAGRDPGQGVWTMTTTLRRSSPLRRST